MSTSGKALYRHALHAKWTRVRRSAERPPRSDASSQVGWDVISCSTQRRPVTWCWQVNEAMANAAEFAYVTGKSKPGAMHVLASYDGTAATLTVTVGPTKVAWRNVDPAKD